MRTLVSEGCEGAPLPGRLGRVLRWLGIPRSTWSQRRVRVPQKPKPCAPVPEALAETIRQFVQRYPWWGYKRIAVVARRAGVGVSNK